MLLAQLEQLRALALQQQQQQVSVLRQVLAQPWVQEPVLVLLPPQQEPEPVQVQQHHSQPPRRQ